MNVNDYRTLYLSEAEDGLQALESGLIGLESSAEPAAVINELFRHAHNLKGISGAMGYDEVVEASHALENVLDGLRRGEEITVAKIGCMLGAADIMKKLVRCAAEAAESMTQAAAAAASDEGAPGGAVPGGEGSPAATVKSVELLSEVLMLLSNISDPSARASSTTRPVSEGEAGTSPGAKPADSLARPISSTKVEIERLDRIMDMVGELVTSRIRLSNLATELGSKPLADEIALSWRLISQVQREVMEARLIPVGQVFQRFNRLVHDVSHDRGKKVKLEVAGAEIGLDRVVLEGMVDPLVHLIRNALDHGIESPAQRLASGKPEEGKLRLCARRERGTVVLEVSDDGRGIDTSRVAAEAAAAGLVRSRKTELGEDDLCRILTTPGFSTSAAVDRVSGRGMGMNIVKKAVDSLGGQLRIRSAPGAGTSVSLILPINLSIIKALLFSIGSDVHAVPIEYVSETTRIEFGSLKTVNGALVLPHGDRVVPVLMPEHILGVRLETSGERYARVIVLDTGRRRVAVVVNRVIGQQDIVIKALPPLFRGLRGISGATVLGSGKVAFIWDPHVLFEGRCTYESDQEAVVSAN
jgi:two-component system, chemotaxis family, sensor kinase CheA